MVRAAAKNHAWVGVVTSPDQYDEVAAAVESGGLDSRERARLRRRPSSARPHTTPPSSAGSSEARPARRDGAAARPHRRGCDTAKTRTSLPRSTPRSVRAVVGGGRHSFRARRCPSTTTSTPRRRGGWSRSGRPCRGRRSTPTHAEPRRATRSAWRSARRGTVIRCRPSAGWSPSTDTRRCYGRAHRGELRRSRDRARGRPPRRPALWRPRRTCACSPPLPPDESRSRPTPDRARMSGRSSGTGRYRGQLPFRTAGRCGRPARRRRAAWPSSSLPGPWRRIRSRMRSSCRTIESAVGVGAGDQSRVGAAERALSGPGSGPPARSPPATPSFRFATASTCWPTPASLR